MNYAQIRNFSMRKGFAPVKVARGVPAVGAQHVRMQPRVRACRAQVHKPVVCRGKPLRLPRGGPAAACFRRA